MLNVHRTTPNSTNQTNGTREFYTTDALFLGDFIHCNHFERDAVRLQQPLISQEKEKALGTIVEWF